MIKVYGIKQCSTMKKAFDWLAANNLPYEFHDYKKFGISHEQIKLWAKQLGWKVLLNTKGTTWRKLPEAVRDGISEETALQLMQEQPSLIKRPVIEAGGKLWVGYDEAQLARLHKEAQ
ncbi:arsenate reductase [Uliginosibacterium gangwonense]|uniref:arsenate reductase n=1 Tax=Uliginosibacterium gangwonense TaxID=392736 RepID=UPI0003808CD9|nr:arsenate reductase [Uliginosibacterium gangwonense]